MSSAIVLYTYLLMRFISRTSIVLLFAMLIWLSSSVFSQQFNSSFGNALKSQNLWAKDVSQMFGDGKVINFYDSALTLVKNNEVKVTFASIDAIMNTHAEFSLCNISADDVMNVLYSSKPAFRSMLELTVINTSKKKVSVPSNANIFASFERFLHCRVGQTDYVLVSNAEDVIRILSAEYDNPIGTTLNQQTLTQSNYWDDIFQNWTLDDSDYDLVVDITQLGKKFFESFTTPVQTLFYELPKISSLAGMWSNGWWWTVWWNDSSQPWGTFEVLSGWQIVINDSLGNISSWNVQSSAGGRSADNMNIITDPWISSFVNDSNTQTFAPNNLYELPASQCASGVPAEISLPGDVTLTSEQYQNYLQTSFDKITANFELDNSPQFPLILSGSWWSWSSTIYPSWTPNQRVENAIDSVWWSCGQTCNSLTQGEQQNCLNSCLKSCTAQCEDISLTALTDKAYCYSQCLCVTVWWPVGEQWKGMDNMYKIKFCTIPVSAERVTWGKKVYSIEAIFIEIKKVLTSLLNGGEIIKRTPTKEYFDTSLSAIKFQDLFSFTIVTQVKKLFPSISKTTEAAELSQTNATYENAILWMNPDDKNKYIVLGRPIQDQVDAENISDVDEYNAKVASLVKIQGDSIPKLPDPIGIASIKNVGNLNDWVRNFMSSNFDFWTVASQTLQEITALADLLLKGVTKGSK